MRLYVTDSDIDNTTIDLVVMNQSEFNCIKTQPFLASSKFDEVVIELTDTTDLDIVRNLMRVTKVIPKVPDECTSHMVAVLCEIYKDRAAELRFTYMRSKEKFKELIDSMKTQYCWQQFY